MQRRKLVQAFGLASGIALLGRHAPGWTQGVGQRAASLSDRILILLELKGGNDGLNTLVPFANNAYYQLRDTIAVKRDDVIELDARAGLHPELKELMPLWDKGELALLQGGGYPQHNLSHLRLIEIWESASKSNEYLKDGWVTRAMQAGYPARAGFTTEGVVIGGGDAGVLSGVRSIRLNNPQAFVNQAQFVVTARVDGNAAPQHLPKVEGDVISAAQVVASQKRKGRGSAADPDPGQFRHPSKPARLARQFAAPIRLRVGGASQCDDRIGRLGQYSGHDVQRIRPPCAPTRLEWHGPRERVGPFCGGWRCARRHVPTGAGPYTPGRRS